MRKASIMIIIVSILSKLLGFVRETVLASIYGAGNVSDAFIFAYSLPATLFSVIAAAFVTGFIPMFSRVEAESGEPAARRFMNNVLQFMLLFSAVVVALFLLFPDLILGFLLPNATPELLKLVVPFTQVTVFSVFTTCVVQLMTGFLQLRDAFVFPMLMGFPMNIVVIATILASADMGIGILPYGIVVSYLIQAGLILAFAYHKGFRYKFVLDFKDSSLRRMLFLAVPLIIGSSSSTVGDMINKAIVSGIEGGVSYLNYSTRLGGILHSVFGTAVISVVYPSLSRSIARGQKQETFQNFGDAFVSIILFIAPASIGIMILARPIVELVYMRGAFTQEDLNITVPVLVGYSIGLMATSLRELFVRLFYSFQDMKTPMWTSLMVAGVQAVLALVLFRFVGIMGVTYAMSASSIIGLLFLGIMLRGRLKGFPLRHYFYQTVKLLSAAIFMGLGALLTYRVLDSRGMALIVSLGSAIMVGVIIYAALLLVMGIDPVREVLDKIRKKSDRSEM